jgi:ABC-type phosphate transport system permease subunit
MLKPSTLKTVSYIALVCCSLGVLFAILIALAQPDFRSYLSILSWALLIYSSWLATRLSGYELYDEDLKSLGYYIYGILILFVLYLVVNISLGILPAIFLAVKLHNQKTGFDSWMREKAEIPSPVVNENSGND